MAGATASPGHPKPYDDSGAAPPDSHLDAIAHLYTVAHLPAVAHADRHTLAHLHSYVRAAADRSAQPHAHPFADTEPQPDDDAHCDAHQHVHADRHQHTDRYRYPHQHADGHGNRHTDGHGNRHADGHCHGDTDRDGHGDSYVDDNPHAYGDGYWHHPGVPPTPTCSGDALSACMDPMEHPNSHRPLDDRQHVMWALVIVIVVAVSLLYCAGLAGTLARFVLLATPSPVDVPEAGFTADELPQAEPSDSAPPGLRVTPSGAATAAATPLP